MRKLILALALSASLTACTVVDTATGGPVAAANQTKLDEQVGLTVTLAYTAAARAATLAIQTGFIKDQATIARIGELNTRAYAAVLAVRDAYAAGNSAGYLSGVSQARAAIGDLLAAVGGN